MVEGIGDRIIRHLRSPQSIDMQTALKGMSGIVAYLRSIGLENAQISQYVEHEESVLGIEGLDTYEYQLQVTETSPVLKKPYTRTVASIAFVDLPKTTKVSPLLSANPQTDIATVSQSGAEFFGSFVGPTVMEIMDSRSHETHSYPNNGFYINGNMKYPFVETNIEKERKGAFAIKYDGTVVVVDDEQKQTLLTKPDEYRCIAGTSYFLLSSDDEAKIADSSNKPGKKESKDKVSYLIQYTDKMNQHRLAYLATTDLVSRKVVKAIIDLHAKEQGWIDYIGVEMELEGCAFIAKGAADEVKVLAGSSRIRALHERYDHYLLKIQ